MFLPLFLGTLDVAFLRLNQDFSGLNPLMLLQGYQNLSEVEAGKVYTYFPIDILPIILEHGV